MLRAALKDFADLMTKRVFETDYADGRIPLPTKMGEESHIFFILGPQYVKTGVVTAVPGKVGSHRFIIEEAATLQENTITDQRQLLEWALRHPKFKIIEDNVKTRRYVLGFFGETMDASPFQVVNAAGGADSSSNARIVLQSLGTKEATPDNVVPLLMHELYFNQEAFMTRNSSAGNQLVLDPALRYGFLPILPMNRYLLCGERTEQIKMLQEAFAPRGAVVRVSSLTVNALNEALSDGVVEDKQQGLLFIYANRTLLVFGWNKSDPGHVFMRSRRIAEEKAYKASLKQSFLGSAIVEATSAWQKACHIRATNNMGLYFREFPGPSELVLERTLADIFTTVRDSIRPLEFKSMQMKTKDTSQLPAELDTLTLLAE